MAVILTIISWALIILVSHLVQKRKKKRQGKIAADGSSHRVNPKETNCGLKKA